VFSNPVYTLELGIGGFLYLKFLLFNIPHPPVSSSLGIVLQETATDGAVYKFPSFNIMGADSVPVDQEPYSGNALVGAAISIAVVQIVFVAAKFYTRSMQRMKICFDDYLILLALVCIAFAYGTGIYCMWIKKCLTYLYSDGKFGKIGHLHCLYVNH